MSGDAFETVQAVYDQYLNYYELAADDKEALTRNKFVRFMKHDYIEIKYKQKKINGTPVLCFINVRLKKIEGEATQPTLIPENSTAFTPSDDMPPPNEDPFA